MKFRNSVTIRLFVNQQKRILAAPLCVVLLILESTDSVSAVDSVLHVARYHPTGRHEVAQTNHLI